MRELVAHQAEQTAGGRWGLPTKPSYSTGEVTRALGITWGQLRYAIEQGTVTGKLGRDGNGHRMWSETDVDLD